MLDVYIKSRFLNFFIISTIKKVQISDSLRFSELSRMICMHVSLLIQLFENG